MISVCILFPLRKGLSFQDICAADESLNYNTATQDFEDLSAEGHTKRFFQPFLLVDGCPLVPVIHIRELLSRLNRG